MAAGCQGCKSKRYACSVDSRLSGMEYVALEYARDLVLQTSSFDTSQSNVFRLYLANQTSAFDLIVASVGMHDLKVGALCFIIWE